MRCKEIKIGALYPLTGKNQLVGESIKNALEFYVNLVNNQERIDCTSMLKLPYLGNSKVRLIWGDTKGDPNVALAEARRLIEDEGVTSIIGSYQSTVTSAVSLLTEVLKIPYISPDADATMLTERGLKYFFRTGATAFTNTKVFFEMLEEKGAYNYNIASLAENSILGQDEVTGLINLAYAYKKDIIALELYDDNLPITKRNLLNIIYSNPDFLFTVQFQEAGIQTIKTLKELNYYPKGLFDQTGSYIIGDLVKTLGRDADYVIAASVWAKGVTKKKFLADKVNYMFKSIYGEDFNAVNSTSFTGLYVLIDAIARAGSSNSIAIRRALANTNISGNRLILPWSGICFDKTGQNIYASSMLVQILNGVPKIVWPKYLAETNVILPAPPWSKR